MGLRQLINASEEMKRKKLPIEEPSREPAAKEEPESIFGRLAPYLGLGEKSQDEKMAEEVIERKQEQEASMDPRLKEALIVGGMPLLAGLLTGGSLGEGAGAASEGLMALSKRDMDLDEKDEGKLYPVRDPDTGAIYYKTRSQALGSVAPHRRRPADEIMEVAEKKEKIAADYGKGVVKATEPITKEDYLVHKTGKVPTKKIKFEAAPDKPDGWTKPKEDLTVSNVKEYNSKKSKHEDVRREMINIRKQMRHGTLGAKAAYMKLVKSIESGRMTDQDRAWYKSALGLIESVKEWGVEKFDNKYPGRLQSELKKVLRTNMNSANRAISEIGIGYMDQLEGAGVPRDYASQRLGIKAKKARAKAARKSVRSIKSRKKDPLSEKVNRMSREERQARIKELQGKLK